MFPRIYSLSTVGIIRHYNQDYLIHPQRTDFVGSNGVGKSIIADLVQLVFITDKEHIVFGTDGLKKKLRQPYTLPYKSNEGYVFMNIEVTKDKFVTIGTCIPSNQGRKLRPFIILNDSDHHKDIADLAYPKEKLLRSSDFQKDKSILSLEDLTKHMKVHHQLHMKYFTFREDKKEYYNFLFTKKILPINLGIEENLKAFAKVIQSFAKAKSLDIDNSKSLKEFLLEDSERDYEVTFQKHHEDLGRLVVEYKDLEDQIKNIEKKQKRLELLKKKEDKRNSVEMVCKMYQVLFAYRQLKKAKAAHETNKKTLDNGQEKEKNLVERSKELKALLKSSDLALRSAETDLNVLIEIKGFYDKHMHLDSQIRDLEAIILPIVREAVDEVNINDYDTTEILRRVNAVKPVFEKYGSIKAMEQKVEEQKKVIEEANVNLRKEIDELESIQVLAKNSKPDSLFSQVLNAKKKLSKAQEDVLFSLLNVSWNKPKVAIAGDKFVDNLDVLNEANIEYDTKYKGYWFKMGELREFIAERDEPQIFDKVDRIGQALKKRVSMIAEEIGNKEGMLRELDKLSKGEYYSQQVLKPLGYAFDTELLDFTAIKQIRETAAIMKKVSQKVNTLRKESNELDAQYKKLSAKLSFELEKADVNSSYEDILKKRNSLKETKEKVERSEREEAIELAGLQSSFEHLEREVKNFAAEHKERESLYKEREKIFRAKYPEVQLDLEDQTFEDVNPSELERDNNVADLDFQSEYKAMSNDFDETKDGRDPGVRTQTEGLTFNFSVLEHALLGPKIGHLDKIGPYLENSNKQRIIMMETLYETMLKVFSLTSAKYKEYENIIKGLNTFFKGKKISNQYYFKIDFKPNPHFGIEWMDKLKTSSRQVFRSGELPMGNTVEDFIEGFFQKITGNVKRINLPDLLNPKTYFDLSVSLTDQNNKEIPGSTGETYSAIMLLGIARLSKVQEKEQEGVRFLILEETASLDNTNFNTFPNIAEEFGYQIITMTPKPYGSSLDNGWYLHHLIKGVDNPDINYPVPSSFFKTNEAKEDLALYLKDAVLA